jgi:nucleoside-diphosphate-sugar epimerase
MENIAQIKDRVGINFSDIRDGYSLNYLVCGADIIFSVAGQTSHIASMTDPFTDLEINCRSQLAILESCRKNNPDVTIVYASTRQVYGKPRYTPVDEQHPLDPADVNGINKIASEHYYSLYARVYGMRCISLRLTNTYGPRQQLRGNEQGFVGIFIRQAITGKPIHIYGDGTQLRDFNYIDDAVDAFLLAAQATKLKSHVYNLGTEKAYSLMEFVKILSKYCPLEAKLVPFPADHAAIDIGDYQADFSLFRSETGWEPKVGLGEGLKRTIEYFKSRAHHYV